MLAARGVQEYGERKRQAELLGVQDMAYGNALTHLGPSGAGMLTADQVAGLDQLFDADRKAGTDMLASLIQQNNDNKQAALDRNLEWAELGLQRDEYNLNQDELALKVREFEADTNVALQQDLARAGQTGVEYKADPITGVEFVVPAPGTDDWMERVDKATFSTNAANTFNEYAKNVAEFGVLRDPSHPEYGVQDSLRTQTTFAIKEATKAGALDAGLLEVTANLTGSATDATDYFLGNDQQTLGRIAATSRMFSQQMEIDQNNTRLLSGISPEQRGFYTAVAQESFQMPDYLAQRAQQVGAEGGNVLVDQEVPAMLGAGSGRNRTRQERQEEGEERGSRVVRVRPGDATREAAAVTGAQIDNIISATIGSMVGRGFAR